MLGQELGELKTQLIHWLISFPYVTFEDELIVTFTDAVFALLAE